MTFLVLLISVAVLEYILNRAESTDETSQPADMPRLSSVSDAPSSADTSGSLQNLGQALDQYGRGAVPEPPSPDAPKPAASSPGVVKKS
jgi:hypothetical protein